MAIAEFGQKNRKWLSRFLDRSSALRRMAWSLLKNNRGLKVGVKNNRLAAGWDEGYLEPVLFGQ